MSPLVHRPVARMNGAGNAIVVLDLRGTAASVSPAEARAIGRAMPFDQLMILHDPVTAGTMSYVTIRNIDGSAAQACGNGTRCVAFLLGRESGASALTVETVVGLIDCTAEPDGTFTVDMGPPHFEVAAIPLADPTADTLHLKVPLPDADLPPAVAVSMGNPHIVLFGDATLAASLPTLGPRLEHHPLFPERANISAAEVLARDHIRLRVWERGAGLTLACGTAACATLVAAVRRGLADRRARVTLPGGDLTVEWRADGHVLMTGPVELESEGVLPPAVFADEAA